MTELERAIIKATQAGLPLQARPFQVVAEQLGVTEKKVLATLQSMKAEGKLRRIGAVPNHYALGYVCNVMTVWDVVDERAEALGEKVGALDFVSHCYLRPRHLPDWPYNLFAMVHGRSETKVDREIQQIRVLLGEALRGFDRLKSTQILKKTGLRLG